MNHLRISPALLSAGSLLALLTLASDRAAAAPLDAGVVAADARWVVHVDFDAMRDSTIGKNVREKCLSNERAEARLKKFQVETGVDLRTDLHGMTLYDTRFLPHSGVAVFRASNMDRRKLVAKAKARHKDLEANEHGAHTIYTWTEKGKRHEHKVSAAFHGDQTIVFSRDPEQVEATLKLLDGSTRSIAANSRLAEPTAPGTFVVARAVGIDEQKTPFRSEAVRRSKRFSLTMGERSGELITEASLVTADPETAKRIQQVVEGFRALAQLRIGSDKSGGEVLQGLTVTADDSTVALKWPAKSETVARLIARQHERMEKWRAQAKERIKAAEANKRRAEKLEDGS